jgi:hypothetical protein
VTVLSASMLAYVQHICVLILLCVLIQREDSLLQCSLAWMCVFVLACKLVCVCVCVCVSARARAREHACVRARVRGWCVMGCVIGCVCVCVCKTGPCL